MSSSPGGNSCSFHLFYFPFCGSLWPASLIFHPCPLYMLEIDWIQTNWIWFEFKLSIFYLQGVFFPLLFLLKSHKYNARGASALHGLTDFMRQLSASESIKQTGSLRNQTLVCWFKGWASHKVMALKYNSALECWGERWRQSIDTHQWELLSFVLLLWEVSVLITSEVHKHRDRFAAYKAPFKYFFIYKLRVDLGSRSSWRTWGQTSRGGYAN